MKLISMLLSETDPAIDFVLLESYLNFVQPIELLTRLQPRSIYYFLLYWIKVFFPIEILLKDYFLQHCLLAVTLIFLSLWSLVQVVA